jgi:hypothetical protein
LGRGEVVLGFPGVHHQTGQNHQSQLQQTGIPHEVPEPQACELFHNLFCCFVRVHCRSIPAVAFFSKVNAGIAKNPNQPLFIVLQSVFDHAVLDHDTRIA